MTGVYCELREEKKAAGSQKVFPTTTSAIVNLESLQQVDYNKPVQRNQLSASAEVIERTVANWPRSCAAVPTGSATMAAIFSTCATERGALV